MQNQPESSSDLNTAFEKIQEIAAKSTSSDYIYRGEPEHYQEDPYRGKVSSSLWRQFKKEMGEEPFDITTIQGQMLDVAKSHTHETDEIEIMTELQHYGGQTNLIDFTTDYHIALFFACDGSDNKDGRVILLPKTEDIEDQSTRRVIRETASLHRRVRLFDLPRDFLNRNNSQQLISRNASSSPC